MNTCLHVIISNNTLCTCAGMEGCADACTYTRAAGIAYHLGKRIDGVCGRIENQIQLFSYIPFMGKFGGATGNFNAHAVAYPKYNWVKFADAFVEEKLGLQRQQYTTQIEHYDTSGCAF